MKNENLKDRLNIFVSIAPSHNRNFETILFSNNIEGKKILINSGDYPYDENLWDKVFKGKNVKGNPSSMNFSEHAKYQLKKIKAYRDIIRKVKRELPKTNFNLYYCNLEDVINNIFFFSFRKNLIQERVLVEDGILNYYDYKISKDRRITFLIKKILCNLLGLRYKIVKGQLSGIDRDIVKKQYVKHPLKAIFPEKAYKLGYKAIDYIPLTNTVLFVGQDVLENVLGVEEYVSCLNTIIGHIKEIDETETIFYKPHRNGNSRLAREKLAETFGKKYRLVEDRSPVEEILESLRPKYIFSFYSTALVNIKMALKEEYNVQVYSLPLNTLDTRVVSLFKDVGIKVLM